MRCSLHLPKGKKGVQLTRAGLHLSLIHIFSFKNKYSLLLKYALSIIINSFILFESMFLKKKKHVCMLHLYMLHLYILYAKFFTRGIWELEESGTIPHVDSSLISSCVNVLI